MNDGQQIIDLTKKQTKNNKSYTQKLRTPSSNNLFCSVRVRRSISVAAIQTFDNGRVVSTFNYTYSNWCSNVFISKHSNWT